MADTAPIFELQSHSVHSDGELSPSEVVDAAADAGVHLLSLTDHDSVEGVPEAVEAARKAGVALVPGVEISALFEDVADLHILGYQVDIDNPPLRERLQRSRADRETRAGRMIDALRGLGFAVDEEMLRARAGSGKTIGRPHIAQAVVEHAANAEKLAKAGLTGASAFLEAYLIEGRPAFSAREAPAVEEAIELIHGAGGVAVWAHPFWDVADPTRVVAVIERFVHWGIDGVEAFYVTHTKEQTELLVNRCAEHTLLTTGSSDFHGPGHRQFNRFRAFETYGFPVVLRGLQPPD